MASKEEQDWRLAGQRSYLRGAALVWMSYRASSETWEHDHCVFCWAKFMDPNTSPAARRFIEEHPEVLIEGYTTTGEHEHGAGYHWICEQCHDDFADLFEWRDLQTPPPTGTR